MLVFVLEAGPARCSEFHSDLAGVRAKPLPLYLTDPLGWVFFSGSRKFSMATARPTQAFTLSNHAQLRQAHSDLKGATNPELMQAIARAARAAGIEVLAVGRFGVSGRLATAQFEALFGFLPEVGRGYKRNTRLPGPDGHFADVLQVAPPLEMLVPAIRPDVT